MQEVWSLVYNTLETQWSIEWVYSYLNPFHREHKNFPKSQDIHLKFCTCKAKKVIYRFI